MLGRCILWQVPVYAPGTAKSATFLPLKMSSVVLTCGPSAVITRNFVSGSLSPTLIVIVNSPWECAGWVLDREGGRYNIRAGENGNGVSPLCHFEHDPFRKNRGHFSGSCFSRKTLLHPERPVLRLSLRVRVRGCDAGSGRTGG